MTPTSELDSLISWIPLLVNIAQVIAPIFVAITLAFVIKTFYRTKRADEIKLTESVFKDLRAMLQDLNRELTITTANEMTTVQFFIRENLGALYSASYFAIFDVVLIHES